MSNKKNTSSDLQGITRLITDATIGVTDLVEAVHQRIVHPPFLPSTPIQHLITKVAGFTYNGIRWSTRLIGSGTDKALGQLTTVFGEIETTDKREVIRAVLNGVIGDYLEKKNNPLQINMQLKYQGKAIDQDFKNLPETNPRINGKIILMIHGLCMNDAQWTRKEHNHGTLLAKELGQTPVYLQYNTGRHVSTNGQELSELLEKLVQYWPVPVEELVIIGYSMGGLISRSAIHYAEQQQKSWTTVLKKIVFLGTPHHGAQLERAGNYLDVILENAPYTKPFARLGKIRSAGITDLRYGNLSDKDWQEDDRFRMQLDPRKSIPLPEQLACYCIAGTFGKASNIAPTRLLGDGLVTIESALGKHKDSDKNLDIDTEHTWIAYETTHLGLLNNLDVYAQIKTWLESDKV